jgi:hypothetical protein
MKKNVKNGKEAVKPAATGHAVLPFFISPLINGNYFCLDTRDITPVILTGYRGLGLHPGGNLKTCPVMVRCLRIFIIIPLAQSALKSTYQLRL